MEPGGWIPVKNTAAADVPPGGILVPGAVEDQTGSVTVARPSADHQPGILVNGEVSLSASGYGNATDANSCVVAYDPADGVPAHGEFWGVKAGTYLARKGYSGFVVASPGMPGTFNGLRSPLPPPPATIGFGRTDLSDATSPYTWYGWVLDPTGNWVAGTDSGTDNAVPVRVADPAEYPHTSPPPPFTPTPGAVMLRVLTPGGMYAFLPIQYAGQVGSTGTYYGGFLSAGVQVIGGQKTFQGPIDVFDGTHGTLRLQSGTASVANWQNPSIVFAYGTGTPVYVTAYDSSEGTAIRRDLLIQTSGGRVLTEGGFGVVTNPTTHPPTIQDLLSSVSGGTSGLTFTPSGGTTTVGGVLNLSSGGTGATTAAGVRSAIKPAGALTGTIP